jgi:hypothetical protein
MLSKQEVLTMDQDPFNRPPGIAVQNLGTDDNNRNKIRTAVLQRVRDIVCDDEKLAAINPEELTALALVLTACNHKD